jgi:tartrate-resistant acid phosphatase type 5
MERSLREIFHWLEQTEIMIKRITVVLFAIALLYVPASFCQDEASQKQAQPAPIALSDAILNRLPAAYREEAKSLVTTPESNQQRWLNLSDEDLTAAVIGQLGRKPEAADFLVAQLEKESSGRLRGQIIDSLGGYWSTHPESRSILERHAQSDPDADVSIRALETLREQRMDDLSKLLQKRLEEAKRSQDAAGAVKLAEEEGKHFDWKSDIRLPFFLRVPPPVFSVTPADKPIRVLAFGDFGSGSDAQKQLAQTMVEYNQKHPFDFGLTLGDNFYGIGVSSPSDPQWKSKWEDMYAPLGIKFYPTLGNHDYGQPDSPAAEILYSSKSSDWVMPSPYYTFTAGPAQFFAIDTMSLSDAELLWLDQELGKSQASWKIVYGHYHIYSATRGDNQELIEKLLPILEKNHVPVYLNGHDHNLQRLKPEGGVNFFVSGGGGAGLYDLKPYDRSVYREKVNGFTVIEADAKQFRISFIGSDGKELHTYTLEK